MPALSLRGAELGLLLALAFFLPLYEAPKSLAWVAYACVWLANRVRSRDFGGRWDGWDSLVAAWLASAVAAAAFAGLQGSEWRGLVDIVRYGSVLWMLKRSRLDEREARWVIGMLAASALLGLAMGSFAMWFGTNSRLELNSVGHVNHTAIYLGIVAVACFGWWFTGARLVAGPALLLYAGVVATASRGAIGATLFGAAVLALARWPRARWPAAVTVALVIATPIVALVGDLGVVAKHHALTEESGFLNYRSQLWSIALGAWREHPWFGLGIDNFSLVTRDAPEPYRTLFPHAHSLYINTLAERGVAGAAALLALLGALLVSLVRARPALNDTNGRWLVWAAAAGAWIVTCVVGLVNTTLHHEHALLAALLFGLWLSSLR